ncbi:hypothetical protein PHMEG_00034818 [Phytophthora megakarya]|uniref:Uncharacterized protein n=1 Tax=Phytophthora megakarya TaxID=4795 RepID=A0A225UQJ4_9STRA|nr:hypothetical protein PHMEG_00034818 [Phytophthora megakarya]
MLLTSPLWIQICLTGSRNIQSWQRSSDLLTPYVAPEFATVSAQKYWVNFKWAFLPSPVPSDAEIKCTTVGIEKFSDYPERRCGVWRRPRGYSNEKQAVMSFAIYEPKHWVSPEAVKRFWSRITARLLTIKDADERRKFKLAFERLKKVWFTYNKERADRADNVRTFLSGRMWTLLDPTLSFYTIENLMWIPDSTDWCKKAALVDKSEPYRVDWLTCLEQHPYNTVYVPCNAHVPLFLPDSRSSRSTERP